MSSRALVPLLALGLVGCKRPPEAPAELSELCSYLFEHMGDEDPEALAAGTQNLATWFSTNGLEAPEEGFEVTNMDADAVFALEDTDLSEVSADLDGLVGAAVVNQHGHGMHPLSQAIVAADQLEVFPDDYQVFERDFVDDVDCFMQGDCESVTAFNYSEASYAGILNVKSENKATWRWVELESQTALVHRAWLTGPADISIDAIQIPAEFFLTATLRMDDGVMIRLQTVWVIAEVVNLDLPEATVLNMFVKSLSKSGDQVEAYLDEERG